MASRQQGYCPYCPPQQQGYCPHRPPLQQGHPPPPPPREGGGRHPPPAAQQEHTYFPAQQEHTHFPAHFPAQQEHTYFPAQQEHTYFPAHFPAQQEHTYFPAQQGGGGNLRPQQVVHSGSRFQIRKRMGDTATQVITGVATSLGLAYAGSAIDNIRYGSNNNDSDGAGLDGAGDN